MTKFQSKTQHSTKSISQRARLVVYRSLNNIFAQIVDDTVGKTLVSANSLKISGSLVHKAEVIGKEIAQSAQKIKIKQIVFDRNGFAYHGSVKKLADTARAEGLDF